MPCFLLFLLKMTENSVETWFKNRNMSASIRTYIFTSTECCLWTSQNLAASYCNNKKVKILCDKKTGYVIPQLSEGNESPLHDTIAIDT